MSRAIVVTESKLDATSLVELASAVADEVVTVAIAEGAAEGAAEVLAAKLKEADASVVVLPALGRYREIAALLTAKVGGACASDALKLERTADGIVADRLLYGGVVIASVLLQRPVAVVTARAGAGVSAAAETLTPAAVAGKELVSRKELVSEGNLSDAAKIVAFGRGVRSKEDMAMVEGLAKSLDANIGCSRPIVDDLKWLPLSNQVGLTGTTVQPELYVAVGISGQIQHLVGMRDSKFIVSINNNPAAPIFDASDLAVVGDLYEIVPKLAAAIASR